MNKLRDKVHSKDWDTIIFLDSCRYDFFKEYYSIYPNLERGELSIAKSPGSATPEVVPKLFDTDEEWYLYSAHNWLGENVNDITPLNSDDDDNTAKPEDFGHPHSRDDAVLRNVPWLSIDSNKALNPMRVSDGEYVRLVYRTVLGREPENEGLSRYTEALKSENERVTRQSLILILLQSDEYRDVFGNPNEICGISGRVSGNADYNKTELGISNVTEDVLDALGYK